MKEREKEARRKKLEEKQGRQELRARGKELEERLKTQTQDLTPNNLPSTFNLQPSPPLHIRIATRKSELALWQANWVGGRLEALGHSVELVLIETKGDKTQAGNKPFAQIAGQGFFTKAVQDALLDGRADMAVHSHKDLPSAPFEGLEVAAVSKRADPRDVLLVRRGEGQALEARSEERKAKSVGEKSDVRSQALKDSPAAQDQKSPPTLDLQSLDLLKKGAGVGTSAVRRQQQLLALRPDLNVKELRGNVPTRVRKLQDGEYDAIVLAAAGLARLELSLSSLRVVPLEPSVMMPAPAQGALALETRRDAYAVASVLTELHDITTYKAVAAERGLMSMLQGGCQLALGAYATYAAGVVTLRAWYEGQTVEVANPSSEGAAMLAFDALGRPTV